MICHTETWQRLREISYHATLKLCPQPPLVIYSFWSESITLEVQYASIFLILFLELFRYNNSFRTVVFLNQNLKSGGNLLSMIRRDIGKKL